MQFMVGDNERFDARNCIRKEKESLEMNDKCVDRVANGDDAPSHSHISINIVICDWEQ